MDLLAGGSDSEDDDIDSIVSDDSNNKNDSEMKSAQLNINSNARVEMKQQFTKTQKQQRVIGKRIIGLEAVLPQNIRDRMAMVKTFDDDSDSDDEEVVQQQATSQTATTAGGGGGHDLELSGLLSELKQSKSTITTISNNNTNANGAHSTKSMLTQDKLPQVETVEEEEGNKEETGSIPIPSLSNRVKATVRERTRVIAPSVSSVPAPAFRKVSSAVPQPSRLLHVQQEQQTRHDVTTKTSASTSNLVSHNSYETATLHDHASTIAATGTTARATTTTTTATRQNHNQKKRSRQKMEQALRSGNLDVVDKGQYSGTSTVVTFGDNYQEGTTTFTLDNGSQQPQHQQHAQYNFPKIDTDTIDTKAKGKHQINQLLAQASQLERRRAEQSSMMGHTTTGSSTKRSGSKQKYGW